MAARAGCTARRCFCRLSPRLSAAVLRGSAANVKHKLTYNYSESEQQEALRGRHVCGLGAKRVESPSPAG